MTSAKPKTDSSEPSRSSRSSRLTRLLRPRSVAAIGGDWAANVVRQCRKMNFPGDIWPVNPARESLGGMPCFKKIADLPAPPDAAFVGVNRKLSAATARELAAAGCGGAVFFAAGFAEADGENLQRQLVAAAGTMPLLGPNCYGVLNYLDGVPLWPDQHGGKKIQRGVAVVSQSSNIANNITMQRRGLPLAYAVCVGNQAQTGMSEIGAALLEDPRVTALGFYVEGVDDPESFARMADLAREKNKPVAVLHVGKTRAARAAALSHTASLAGGEAASRAFFRRVGIPAVETVPELLESLKLFHIHGALAGNNICSVSCSGGEAALMADRAGNRDLRFGELSESSREKIRAALDDAAPARNPLDYHTFIWGNEPALAKTFAAMMENNFDLSLAVLDFPRPDRCESAEWDAVVRACETAGAQAGARMAIVSTLPENIPEARAADLMNRGIAPLAGFDEALAAAEAAARFGEKRDGVPPVFNNGAKPNGSKFNNSAEPDGSKFPTRMLDEAEAKRRLNAFGISIPAGMVAATPRAVADAAAKLGPPLAVKVLGVAHKTESGAVALNLRNADDARAFANRSGGGPWLVEKMIPNGVAELLLGVSRDPVFGLTLTVGAGGILTELLNDSATVLLPTDANEIRAALAGLRCAPLLAGFRGRPAAAVESIVAAALGLAAFAKANMDSVEEVDINPLIASPDGATAADALIQIREKAK